MGAQPTGVRRKQLLGIKISQFLMSGFVALPWLLPFAPGPSPSAFQWLASAFCAVVLVCVVAKAHREGPPAEMFWRELVLTGWMVAAVAGSVIALVQYFGLAGHFSPIFAVTEPGLAYGNLRQRNQMATLTVIGLAIVWGRGSHNVTRPGQYIAIVVLAAANAATTSRTGFTLLLMLTLLSFVWTTPTKPVRACFASWAAYTLSSMLLPTILAIHSDSSAANVWWRLSASSGCSSRTILWSNVLALISERPWLGGGWGELAYAHYSTPYNGPRFCEILDNAHNLPLHLAVELGIPFACVVCALTLWFVLRRKPWRDKDIERQTGWTVLAAIAIHSLVEYPLWYGPFQLTFILAFLMVCRPAGKPLHITGGLISRPWRLVIASAALIGLTYVSWDYYRVTQIYLPREMRAEKYRDDTLAKVQDSWIFRRQVQFAELATTPLTRANAAHIAALAEQLLHFSPEPRVAEKLIESLVMLGRDNEAVRQMARFREAFPKEYANWSKQQGAPAWLVRSP
ncbi:MAG: O-antigen ligase C-terminal domain-containing protein [Ramlibacter sp.]|nr:O-antigen ligase C-terminal domain-containing protein [Ramlibacter sp.]